MFKCLVCGGEIKGAIHVEVEGYYHPECFNKTDKGQRVLLMSELLDYAWKVYVDKVAAMIIDQVKKDKAEVIARLKLSDDDLMALIKSRFGL